jgi:hypothetical protein
MKSFVLIYNLLTLSILNMYMNICIYILKV